jgi:UDP-galactopyranose mutase
VLIHKYGPYIFHTNSREVFDYLGQFTQWRPYQHRVRASIDGQLLPIRINVDPINAVYGLNLTALEVDDFLASIAEPREQICTSEAECRDLRAVQGVGRGDAQLQFAGRLATYKYYNMDQVVAQALTVFRRLAGEKHADRVN